MIIASPLAALMVPMVLVTTPLAAVAPNQTTASMTALRQWVEAVTDHVPGEPDASVRYVAGMTYSARVELNKLYPLFIKVLQEDFVVTRSRIDSDVAALARTVTSALRLGGVPEARRNAPHGCADFLQPVSTAARRRPTAVASDRA